VRQESGLTTKKSGDENRPRMKSSHEKVKAARGASRASGSSTRARSPSGGERARSAASGASERGRSLRKARPSTGAPAGERERERGDGGDGWSVASDAARETATSIAVAAIDKKAVGLEILDVAGRVDYADFLVVMTGRSDRHAQALAQGIEEALRKKGVRPIAVEGLPHGSWVLMDFGDVVVHVFQDEARQLYDIEGLWLDARRLPVPISPGAGGGPTSD
jgi:ribosome-associated protein